jgi:hypothetical protein
MVLIQKILIRVALLTAIFFLANFIYEKTLWKQDLESGDGKILTDLLNAQDSADVIYMGESSNFSTHKNDTCLKSISDFAADYFPKLVFRPVHKGAIHAGTYLALLNQVKNTRRLQTIIITLNLRSFDADWINSRLETSLQRTNILFQKYPPLMNRFLLSLNAYNKKTEKQRQADFLAQISSDPLNFPYPFKYKTAHEWDGAMANGGYVNPDGSWNMPKIELACHYIKTYGFQINTETNPRIKDFDEIVKVCRHKNIRLVFNLLAENIQYADSLVGKDLVFLIKQNRDLLVKRYNKDGVVVADNLELVCGKDYIDQNWTTEHYNQWGRMRVARNLANSLKTIYPKEFTDLKINIKGCNPDPKAVTDTSFVLKALKDIENRIRLTPEWMAQIKEKAAQKNITIDEMIRLDAKYVYDTEQKK